MVWGWFEDGLAIYADVFDSFCGNPRDLREYIYRSITRKNFPLMSLIYAEVFDSFCGNPRDLREYIYRSITRKKISR